MRGFTLVEILLALGILGLMLAVAQPSYSLFLATMGAQDAEVVYVQTLRRAQLLSEAGKGDSAWGVRISTSSILLYKGSGYASRDTAYDEAFTSATQFSVFGLTDVVFTKFTGFPNAAGTTTITTPGTSPAYVAINAKGTISY